MSADAADAVRDQRLARMSHGDADARAQALAYRLVRLPTGMHPFAVRALGFPGHKAADPRGRGQAPGRSLALLDRLGTVPALRYGSQRVQTNRHIARFLDEAEPQPPLFPADAQRRRDVEEAEAWGDEVFQMSARRLGLTGSLDGLDNFRDRGNSGRLGALLSPQRDAAPARGARRHVRGVQG